MSFFLEIQALRHWKLNTENCRSREGERHRERVRSPKNSDCDDIITMLGISDIDVGGMSPDYLERVLLHWWFGVMTKYVK